MNNQLKQIKNIDFKIMICNDFNINIEKEIKLHFSNFRIVKGKRKISATKESIIVDRDGNEYPYFIGDKRNNERLVNFSYIKSMQCKTINEIITELNLDLKPVKCKICEGGGWYTDGICYTYKNFYSEF